MRLRASKGSRQRSLEAPAGLAERLAFAKAKSLRWANLVHDGRTTFAVLAVKGAVAHREEERWVVLRSVPIGYAPGPGLVAHHYSVACDRALQCAPIRTRACHGPPAISWLTENTAPCGSARTASLKAGVSWG